MLSTGGVISDADVETIVKALRAIDHESAWDRVLKVGQTVFEGLAGGDERAWLSHRRQKNVSLRKLAENVDCPFRKTALSSAISVYLFTKANPEALSMSGIKPTHVAQVTALGATRGLAVLAEAAANSWSVRDVAVRVRQLRKASGEKRGRPLSSLERKSERLARYALMSLKGAQSLLTTKQVTKYESREAMLAVLDELDDLLLAIRNLPVLLRRGNSSPVAAALPVVTARRRILEHSTNLLKEAIL